MKYTRATTVEPLLDHELSHCWGEEDEKTGKTKWSVIGHDAEVVARRRARAEMEPDHREPTLQRGAGGAVRGALPRPAMLRWEVDHAPAA